MTDYTRRTTNVPDAPGTAWHRAGATRASRMPRALHTADAPRASRPAGRHALTICALAATLVCTTTLSGCGAWGYAAQSALDRLTSPQVTMWAPAPAPDSFVESYGDTTGAGTNYVYRVEAATERGDLRTLTVIFFGRKAAGTGWLEIDAQGASGVHYQTVEDTEVPQAALDALDDTDAPH